MKYIRNVCISFCIVLIPLYIHAVIYEDFIRYIQSSYEKDKWNQKLTDDYIERINPDYHCFKEQDTQEQKDTLLRDTLKDFNLRDHIKRASIIYLIYSGANPNITQYKTDDREYGDRPLVCVDKQDYDLTRYLLEKGADPNLRVESLYGVPLFLAKSVALAELLVQYGANVHEKDFYGGSLLHTCMGYEYPSDLLQWYIEKHHLDVNRHDCCGYTPLYDLVSQDILFVRLDNKKAKEIMIQKITILMRAGANPILKNKNDRTPMGIAYEERKKEKKLSKTFYETVKAFEKDLYTQKERRRRKALIKIECALQKCKEEKWREEWLEERGYGGVGFL